MRVKVIINPYANRGRALKLKEQLVAWARPYGQLDIAVTEQPKHATALARTAAAEGYDVVAAAGGDGTVHEVANGLVNGNEAGTALGLLPIGTGNDLAYGLGLLADPQTAVKRLFNGDFRRVDLGCIEDDKGRRRIFANGVGVGLDALVAIEAIRIKRLQGFPLYLAAALRTIALRYYAPRLELRFDNEVVRQFVLLLAVGIGPRAGGGFLLTPDASFDDGFLDSCLATPMRRWRMVSLLVQSMKGNHVNSPFVTMRRNQVIHIESALPLPIHTDGEIFAFLEDDVRWVKICCLPDALRIAC